MPEGRADRPRPGGPLRGRLTVARLNVDDEPRAAGRYDVLSLPTLILFRGGEPVERLAGAVKPARLERAVAAHLDARDD